jgi:PAS domain S-box-containing protein
MDFKRPAYRGFVVAFLATALVAVAQHVVYDQMGISSPVFIFFLPVLAATWYGGVPAGLFATLLGAGACAYLNIAQDGGQALTQSFQVRLVFFGGLSAFLSWLVDSLRSARQRLVDRQRELELRHVQLEQEIVERRRAEAAEKSQREQLIVEMRRRQELEWAVRDREERTRMAVESANIGTFDLNPLTGERKWSDRTKIMFGLSADADVSDVSFLDRLHPDDKERAAQALQKAFDPSGDGIYDIDLRLLLPDHTVRWFIAKGQAFFDGEVPNRRAVRFIGTVLDITERKQAELALRQAEERFRTLATNAPVGIFQTDAEGRCLFVNRAWCQIVGAEPEESLGDGWMQCVHPDDVHRVAREWQKATMERRNHSTEFRFANHATGDRNVIASAAVLFDATDTVTGYVGTIVDITERKAAEAIVKQNEALLRGVLDNVPAIISLKDMRGRYRLVNRAWETMSGVTNDEIVGLTNYDLMAKNINRHMSQKMADTFRELDRKVMETGETIEFEENISPDRTRIYATVKFPIRDCGGRVSGVGGISSDITERRRALESLEAEQELLRHTIEIQDHQRQLIAYEIHDGVVQYVAGALMEIESIRDDELASPAAAEKVKRIFGILQKALAEGRQLINGIRTPVLDDWGIVPAIEQLIEDERRANVRVRFVNGVDVGRMAPRIEETLYRITQEALTNAYKHSNSKEVQVELVRTEDRVKLEVRDWGVGFVPAVDSKSVHGLKGMVKRATIIGGKCVIDSIPGKGTKVIVDLPYVTRI